MWHTRHQEGERERERTLLLSEREREIEREGEMAKVIKATVMDAAAENRTMGVD